MSLDNRLSTPTPTVASTGSIVAIFALLGPLVGSIAMMALLAVFRKVGGFDGVFVGLILSAGYILGIAPAALTGFAVARSRRSALPTPVRGALFGAVIAALFGALVVGALVVAGHERPAVMFAGMGAVSGLVCGMVSDRWTA